jgi:uncharacterized protein YndB with AHSA1/START domain
MAEMQTATGGITMTTTESAVATHTYTIYVDATPEAIWNAITDGAQTVRYGYGCPVEYDLRPGGAFRVRASDAMSAQGMSGVIIDGEVIEAHAPRTLVQTWNPLFGPPVTDEPATRIAYEIKPVDGGGTQVTITHELDGAPITAGLVTGEDEMGGGGWAFMLSDLKTLLETGKSFAGS